jgi:hypothetical protein
MLERTTTLGTYYLVVTPWIRSLDSRKTFAVRVYDNSQDAKQGGNVIAYISESLRTLDACNGPRMAAKYEKLRASRHSVESILKTAHAALA